jgi:hypothetical protein
MFTVINIHSLKRTFKKRRLFKRTKSALIAAS